MSFKKLHIFIIFITTTSCGVKTLPKVEKENSVEALIKQNSIVTKKKDETQKKKDPSNKNKADSTEE